MANFGPLAAEIGSGVWGTPANFNGFRVLASLVERRRSPEAKQALHDVWSWAASATLYIYTLSADLAPNGISTRAKFTLRPSLAFSYTGSVTARHFSSGFSQTLQRRPSTTFADGATYIRLGGHHVGHRPTFQFVQFQIRYF